MVAHCNENYRKAQTGDSFVPRLVSCSSCVPSARMDQIWVLPSLSDENTMCVPLGENVGCSLRPALWVNCV